MVVVMVVDLPLEIHFLVVFVVHALGSRHCVRKNHLRC